MEELLNVEWILRCFELLSGLKINFKKSHLCGVEVLEQFIEVAAIKLKCGKSAIPFKYLGIPLVANPKRIKTWEPFIDRFKKRLANWKSWYLSIGGRLTVIKPALSNLPVYFLSFYKMPVIVANKLEKIQRVSFGEMVRGKERWVVLLK